MKFFWMVISDFPKGFLISYVVCIMQILVFENIRCCSLMPIPLWYSEHTLQIKIAASLILFPFKFKLALLTLLLCQCQIHENILFKVRLVWLIFWVVCMLYCYCKFMYVLVKVLLSIYGYVTVLFQQKDLMCKNYVQD